MDRDFDTIVVGGGASGLSCARALSQKGLRVLIVEGRGRLGGRVATLHNPAYPIPIELGAEFIDVPGPDMDMLMQADSTAYRSTNGEWAVEDGNATYLSFENEIKKALDKLTEMPKDDVPFIDFFNKCCSGLDDRAKRLILDYIEGYHASHVDKIGTKWLYYASQGGGGGGRVRNNALHGMDRIIDGLRQGLGPTCKTMLCAIVEEVKWEKGNVHVRMRSAAGGELPEARARSAVITLPLGVLQLSPYDVGYVNFEPNIEEKLNAARKLGMGNVIKITMRFRTTFWEGALKFAEGRKEEREIKFMHTDGPLPTWWTPSPVLAPVLIGWAGGAAAERLMQQDRKLIDIAVESLAKMLGIERARVEEELDSYFYHDWSADTFSRGAYSYGTVGALEWQKELAKPVENTLFFAGEATGQEGDNATIASAIRTGERAAREVMRALR